MWTKDKASSEGLNGSWENKIIKICECEKEVFWHFYSAVKHFLNREMTEKDRKVLLIMDI